MRHLPAILAFLVGCATVQAQTDDSLRSQRLDEVVISSQRTPSVLRTAAPTQVVDAERLHHMGSLQLSDAVKLMAGVTLKDYGGVGGIKTVNIRSMGTNHLGISYDGIELGNAQNGQIDLGQFSLDNVDEITLFNGQKSAIFQPASDFASASSVYIRTRAPRFEVGKDTNWKLRAKYGASDLLRISALCEHRFSNDLSLWCP